MLRYLRKRCPKSILLDVDASCFTICWIRTFRKLWSMKCPFSISFCRRLMSITSTPPIFFTSVGRLIPLVRCLPYSAEDFESYS